MIVMYPLMTKLKEIKFVKKCIFLAFITTFFELGFSINYKILLQTDTFPSMLSIS